MSTPARSVAARSSASRCSPAARRRCRNSASLESTTSCSPVSASSTTITPASGSSYSRGSTSRIATTSWRWLSCSRGRSQPGGVMKSETRTTSERRRIVRSAVSSSRVRSVTAPFVSGGGRRRFRASARTWLRLLRGGSVSSSSLSKRMAPTAVAAPREELREGRRELAQHELLRPVDRPEAHRAATGRAAARRSARGPPRTGGRTACPSAPSRSSRCAGRRPRARTRGGRGSPGPRRGRPCGSCPAGCRRAGGRPATRAGAGAAPASSCRVAGRPSVRIAVRRCRWSCAPAARAREPGRPRGRGR